MSLLTRYLISRISLVTLFTLLALVALFSFFDIINEASDLGKGHYTLGIMLVHVLLQIPGHIYELLPLAVLIGTLVAMSLLASGSEYTVMRASGVSLLRVGSILVQIGLVFALVTLLMGEFIAPKAEQEAERLKIRATRSVVAQQFNSGSWMKDDRNFINVREILPDNSLIGLRIYSYDADLRLTRTRYAERGFYLGDGSWRLEKVQDSDITPERIVRSHHDALVWKSVIRPEILSVLLVVPEQMSGLNLMAYIDHLKNNSQKTSRYEIALWGKIFYPLACLSMALMALAFTPVNRREGNLGMQLFIGILIGLSFHFFNRLLGHLGLLYDWWPAAVAIVPTLTFLAAGAVLTARRERR